MISAKDESISALLASLDLASRDWVIVDHWEADRCAVGIACSSDLSRLVYVSTYEKTLGMCDYECEISGKEDPAEYRTVASGEDVSFAKLIAVLESHLAG